MTALETNSVFEIKFVIMISRNRYRLLTVFLYLMLRVEVFFPYRFIYLFHQWSFEGCKRKLHLQRMYTFIINKRRGIGTSFHLYFSYKSDLLFCITSWWVTPKYIFFVLSLGRHRIRKMWDRKSHSFFKATPKTWPWHSSELLDMRGNSIAQFINLGIILHLY